jgi:hypothetical protein
LAGPIKVQCCVRSEGDAELRGSCIGFRCGSQVGDGRSDETSGGHLGSRVAICLNPNWHQTKNGNQTKGSNTNGEGQFD